MGIHLPLEGKQLPEAFIGRDLSQRYKQAGD